MGIPDNSGLYHAPCEVVCADLLHGVVAEQAHHLVAIHELYIKVCLRGIRIAHIGRYFGLRGLVAALLLREEVIAQRVGLRGLDVDIHTVVEQGGGVVERVAEIDGCGEMPRGVHLQARSLLGRVAVAVLEEQRQAGQLLP